MCLGAGTGLWKAACECDGAGSRGPSEGQVHLGQVQLLPAPGLATGPVVPGGPWGQLVGLRAFNHLLRNLYSLFFKLFFFWLHFHYFV